MNPSIIHRDIKSSNVLVGNGYEAKLADFGMATVGPTGNETLALTRIMGTRAYIAPEYQNLGQLSKKSDVYSFGIVLLELITGRKAYDATKPRLIAWVCLDF